MNTGVYIHIPFCVRKCPYCDFYSESNALDFSEAYTERLVKEIHERAAGEIVDTVFFGGGTPSLMPTAFLLRILSAIKQAFTVTGDAEITIEVNPGTVSESILSELFLGGFNRISIGVQSLQDNELIALGRIHTGKEAIAAIEMAKSVGFSNINADIMIAVPQQTVSSLSNTLSTLVALDIPHISAYSLIIEEGTPFYENTPPLPEEDLERELYWHMIRFLNKNGYSQYEISNFAKAGFACRHNIKYWVRAPYYGFGAAAHSFVSDTRIANVSDIKAYIQAQSPIEESLIISAEEAERERLMLGFRMLCGVKTDATKEPIVGLIKKGLLEQNGEYVRLTPRGLDLANIVFMEFVE